MLGIRSYVHVLPTTRSVIPAQAGIQRRWDASHWIPASAGMTRNAEVILVRSLSVRPATVQIQLFVPRKPLL